jgi:hypothetical protein
MGDSPLGDILTEEQLALLCGVLVMRAVEHRRRPAQR